MKEHIGVYPFIRFIEADVTTIATTNGNDPLQCEGKSNNADGAKLDRSLIESERARCRIFPFDSSSVPDSASGEPDDRSPCRTRRSAFVSTFVSFRRLSTLRYVTLRYVTLSQVTLRYVTSFDVGAFSNVSRFSRRLFSRKSVRYPLFLVYLSLYRTKATIGRVLDKKCKR